MYRPFASKSPIGTTGSAAETSGCPAHSSGSEIACAFEGSLRLAGGPRLEQEARTRYSCAPGAARAYASERVEDAKANAERFEALRPEYARAPEVTRRRLELETARRVLEKVREKTIIDAPLDALPGLTHAPARPSASKASP